MDIRIQYQGWSGSPWMKEYMEGKLVKLERYLNSQAVIEIVLITGLGENSTHLSIQNQKHQYQFDGQGADLFEAFSKVMEEASRMLRFEHQKLIAKVHRKLFGPERIDE